MKVVLKEAVHKLGKAGDVKEVRMGYGFNFLLPRGLAVIATSANIKSVLARVKRTERIRTAAAAQLAQNVVKLEGISVTLRKRAQEGKLYGSVSATEIVETIEHEKDIRISEDALSLAQPIKKVGRHTLMAKAGDVEAEFTLVIEAEN